LIGDLGTEEKNQFFHLAPDIDGFWLLPHAEYSVKNLGQIKNCLCMLIIIKVQLVGNNV
jgi:hypothetical protein